MDVDMTEATAKTETTQGEKKVEVVVDQTFDETAVYKGKVKFFKESFRVEIVPDDLEGLKAAGLKGNKVEASCSDILSNESPAILAKDQEIEFRCRKDNFGIYAIAVTGPSGAAIGPGTSDRKVRDTSDREPLASGQTFQGTIKNFLWRQGFGFVEVQNKEAIDISSIADSKAKKRFEKSGELWFHRSDLSSTDTAVGVNRGETVQFTIYKDGKGMGAQGVCQPGGAAISGARSDVYRGPHKKNKKKKKKGNNNQQQMQKAFQKALMGMMGGGFGPMKGGMGMMNPMQMMMGGMMGQRIMMMNGQPYMVSMNGGKKKRKKKRKNKNKGGKKVEGTAEGVVKTAW